MQGVCYPPAQDVAVLFNRIYKPFPLPNYPHKIITWLTAVFYKPVLTKYLSKERTFFFENLQLTIHPSVFHPGFFFSTRLLLKYLLGLTLKAKSILELGAGNGLISMVAAKAGARVTATDINPVAIQYLQQNSTRNGVEMTIIESDLFDRIPMQVFDMIVINPPYYFKKTLTDKDHAWFCGENGEYFRGLFAALGNYSDKNTVTLIILCEGCDRETIQSIAGGQGFRFTCVSKSRNLIERNYIYQIHRAN